MDLPGVVALGDGRYLERRSDGPRVLVIETEGGPPPARRKRRRPRKAGDGPAYPPVPLTVATVVFADTGLNSPEADEWLRRVSVEPEVGELIDSALATLERAVSAAAAVTGQAIGEPARADRLITARIGYGEGERVYDGRYMEALEIDPSGGAAGSRRERIERIVPLSRIAAILGGRESPHACEIMIPRVRVDLDTDRLMPAALSIGEAVRATVAELEFLLDDPGHEDDLDRLADLIPSLLAFPPRLLGEGSAIAGSVERGEIEAEVRFALELAERVIRRYRISVQ